MRTLMADLTRIAKPCSFARFWQKWPDSLGVHFLAFPRVQPSILI